MATQIDGATRFAFGENWERFLADMTPARVAEAQTSLRKMLDVEHLQGRTFLDIGAGSGLFSLAAHRLGARVTSFDFDGDCVECTRVLRSEWAGDDPHWRILGGSVLDSDFLTGLGGFDVVYAWGVLHHTGDMRLAMDNAAGRVAPGGLLFVALYNDQGRMSQIWSAVKRAYVSGPHALRGVLLVLCGAVLWAPAFARGLRRGRPLEEWRTYESTRGMSKKHDLVDWVGGYPFEVATPAEVFDFYNERSFQLQAMVTRPGLGCNEFVLRRDPSPQEPA